MRYIVSFILGLLPICLVAQVESANPPKVIVSISIDALRSDYLNLFKDEFGEGGFKLLMSESAQFVNLNYDYQFAGNAADAATIATGAQPYVHGIIGDDIYLPNKNRVESVGLDANSKPKDNGLALSAHRMLSTTFADELFEHCMNLSKIVSISVNAEQAIMSVGHSGKAFWLDDISGKFTSSDYYVSQLPNYVKDFDVNEYLNKQWEPLYPAGHYRAANLQGLRSFNYNLASECAGLGMYKKFVTAPQANSMVCDLAIKALNEEDFGKDLLADMLMLNFSLKPFFLSPNGGLSIELEDAYLRLDIELKKLFDQLFSLYGKENVLVYVVSSRDSDNTTYYNQRIKAIPFSIDKYSALLNSYLMAHYGQHKWVLYCSNSRIYLNRRLIEEKNLSLAKVQQTAVDFFSLIPNVLNVCTSYNLEDAFIANKSVNYSYNANYAYDLAYTLAPACYEVDMNNNSKNYRSVRKKQASLYLLGWNIKPQTIYEKCNATSIAPTLSKIMGINLPNGGDCEYLPF